MATWRVSKAIGSLRDEVNARWPGRTKTSDGTLGDAAHSARESDHNPDENGIVHAMDITAWDPDGAGPSPDLGDLIAETLRAGRDPRIKYVIHDDRMFSSYATRTRKAWEWGPYSGANRHRLHVHVSVYGDTAGPWGIHPRTPTPDPGGLTVSDVDKILARLDAVEATQRAQTGKLDRLLTDARAKTAWEGEDRKALAALLKAVREGEVEDARQHAEVVSGIMLHEAADAARDADGT